MQFLKTTVFGGIVFLVPIVIFTFIIGKALMFTRKFTVPLAEILPFGPVGDAIVVNLLGLAFVVLICFLGGLAAKSALVADLVNKLEANFLSKIPVIHFEFSTIENPILHIFSPLIEKTCSVTF